MSKVLWIGMLVVAGCASISLEEDAGEPIVDSAMDLDSGHPDSGHPDVYVKPLPDFQFHRTDAQTAGDARVLKKDMEIAYDQGLATDLDVPLDAGLVEDAHIITPDLSPPDARVLPPPECSNEGDCMGGQVCILHECVDMPPECIIDGDCANGQVCTMGECVEAPPECVNDDDCANGQVCTMGECVEAPPECVNDGDCANGQVCTMGECVEAPPECINDANCANGQACVENECVLAACVMPQRLFRRAHGTTEGMGHLEPTCGLPGTSPEAVYSLIAISDGPLCVHTLGSTFDTILSVRADCAESGVGDLCNDDSGSLQSRVEVNAVLNQTYYVIVDGFGNATMGEYDVAVSPGACPVDNGCNDDLECGPTSVCRNRLCVPRCAADEACNGGRRCILAGCQVPLTCANDQGCLPNQACAEQACVAQGGAGLCANPLVLPGGNGTYLGTTANGAMINESGTCGGLMGSEVVFQWTAAEAGPVCVDTVGSEYDTLLYVRTTCGDSNTELACSDDGPGLFRSSKVDLNVNVGATYFIIVDGFNEQGGTFQLSVNSGACAN